VIETVLRKVKKKRIVDIEGFEARTCNQRRDSRLKDRE
jgi:hypothetical protein